MYCHTAAENAYVQGGQNLAIMKGRTLYCSRIDFRICEALRYVAKNEGAY